MAAGRYLIDVTSEVMPLAPVEGETIDILTAIGLSIRTVLAGDRTGDPAAEAAAIEATHDERCIP